MKRLISGEAWEYEDSSGNHAVLAPWQLGAVESHWYWSLFLGGQKVAVSELPTVAPAVGAIIESVDNHKSPQQIVGLISISSENSDRGDRILPNRVPLLGRMAVSPQRPYDDIASFLVINAVSETAPDEQVAVDWSGLDLDSKLFFEQKLDVTMPIGSDVQCYTVQELRRAMRPKVED